MSIRGFGSGRLPIKKQFHTPVAIHLLERSEVYYKLKKIKFSFCWLPLQGWGAWAKKKKKMALFVWAISHNVPLAWRSF